MAAKKLSCQYVKGLILTRLITGTDYPFIFQKSQEKIGLKGGCGGVVGIDLEALRTFQLFPKVWRVFFLS